MLPLMGNDLIQRLSCYNKEYYCIIEKVGFLPGIIRVFIDERGDNSLGMLIFKNIPVLSFDISI
jgi:hypothetical protein